MLATTLLATTIPVTDKLLKIPTEVRLENNTFELSVFPVILEAGTEPTTIPVNALPSPTKYPED